MARKIIKRFIPGPEWVKKQKSLQILGNWIHEPNLWHLNRHSVTKATFIGVFLAFVPIPSQMIIAAFIAMLFRANLVISVCLVWITNPFTIAPLYYLAYKVGAVVLGRPPDPFVFELSWDWLTNELANNWQPFLLGCLLCGLFFALLTSTSIWIAWRQHTIYRWHQRRLSRQLNQKK